MSIFRLACIDPDTVCAGLAIFEANTKATISILHAGAIRPSKSLSWQDRAIVIAKLIAEKCAFFDVRAVVLEMPQIYQSARGVVASNSGAMEKLIFATGVIFGAVSSQCSCASGGCELINPGRWKGNVPKSVTATRVLRHWGFQDSNNDVTDAVGIGDWYFRKYKRIMYQNYAVIHSNNAVIKGVMN